MLQTDLLIIAEAATENMRKMSLLNLFISHDAARIDELVLALDKITTAGIDCTMR